MIPKKINVITLFSGYDSQCLALNRLKRNNPKFDYELVAWCEIDKYAITAHDALFPQYADRNLGDISKVDWHQWREQHPEPIDLLTYSSPCQDFSSAGLQRGGDEGSGTRSGLLWEVEKAIRALRPKHLVFENVSALVSQKFIGVFNKWQVRLKSYGYTNFAQLMNSKDYGVPQSRERIFMVSKLECDRAFYFPKAFKLEKRLKDVLEKDVDKRYYLSEERVARLLKFNEEREEKGQGFRWKPTKGGGIAASVLTKAGQRPCDNNIVEMQEIKIQQIGNLIKNEGLDNPQRGRIYGTDGLAPTLNTERGGNLRPKILEIQKIKQQIYGLPHGYYGGDIYEDYAPTVKSSAYVANNYVMESAILTPIRSDEQKQGKIRRLTERELFRLMDVEEKDIDTLLSAGISNTQLAKMAGNSIVVSCLYYIFRNIFTDTVDAGTQTQLF